MIHVVCALPSEAKPLIQHFGLKGIAPLFEAPGMRLMLSGVGKIASATAVGYLAALEKNAAWLNIGIAGHRSYPLGTALLAHKIGSHYPCFLGRAPLPTAEVCTVDEPEFSYPSECLYDMEAAGFFSAASQFATLELIHVLKVISDNQDSPAHCVNKKRVEALLKEALPAIEKTVAMLQSVQEEYAKQQFSIEIEPFTKRWHFTETEKIQLKTLLRRFHILEKKCDVSGCHTGSAVLQKLRREI